MAASAGGQLEKVHQLLEAGLDVNQKSPAGATAMIYAARNDHADVVKALLAAGGDPYIQTDLGATATSIAWKFNSERTIKVLEEHEKASAEVKPNIAKRARLADGAPESRGELIVVNAPVDPMRKIIFGGIAVALLLVLFPPHVRPVAADAYASVGFAFIFSPPPLGNAETFATVNVALLALLLIVVSTVTAVLAWLVRENAA